jgi:hypothetical protein
MQTFMQFLDEKEKLVDFHLPKQKNISYSTMFKIGNPVKLRPKTYMGFNVASKIYPVGKIKT